MKCWKLLQNDFNEIETINYLQIASMPLNSCRFFVNKIPNSDCYCYFGAYEPKGKVDVRNVEMSEMLMSAASQQRLFWQLVRRNRFDGLRFNRSPRSHSESD